MGTEFGLLVFVLVVCPVLCIIFIVIVGALDTRTRRNNDRVTTKFFRLNKKENNA